MSKVTSKLQVTIPKAIAQQYGIRPGDDITWSEAGETIRVYPAGKQFARNMDTRRRLEEFDEATQRQLRRQQRREPAPSPADRGWTREDLYDRGTTR